MEQIVSACITGGAAIIGVILMEWLLGKRTFDLLSKHGEESSNFSNNLSKEHKDLSKEHTDLSKDHIKLYQNQKSFLEKLGDIFNKITSIDKAICEEKTAQDFRYQNLTEKQRDIKDYITKIEDMAKDWEKQATVIKELQLENKQLLEKNKDLKKEIDKLLNLKRNDRTDYFDR